MYVDISHACFCCAVCVYFAQHVGGEGYLPTFKMQRGRRYDFFAQRVPSFTDRVLWRSAPGAAACLELAHFNSAPSLVTSDHKPV